ncbi:hypothetical protein HN011_011027 [Eciton burchellii]|nr:hypothetical protein HN011_011027 [Eciton burchellii]
MRRRFERIKAPRILHRIHCCQWKYLRDRSIISWEYPFPYRACRVIQVASYPVGGGSSNSSTAPSISNQQRN